MKHSKIAIIGAGSVGSTTAYAILLKNIAAEIILIDINEVRCKGEILDLSDALSFNETAKVRIGNAYDASQADIIIIAAGNPQMPNQKRDKLFCANKSIFTEIFNTIKPINPKAIIIIVTNPLDTMTRYAQLLAELPTGQVFGTGTFLDTLRLRVIIAEKINISPESVNAFILGEHGDSQFVAWSCAQIAGTPLMKYPGMQKHNLKQISAAVKNKAYEIISCKGSTFFGIASCVARICKAIIFNEKLIIPLSSYHPEYDICISLPVILGERGIEKTLSIPLNEQEQKQLKNSVTQLKAFTI